MPFYAQYSAGYNAAAAPVVSTGKAAVDVVDLRRSQLSDGFTAQAGDRYAMGSLYTGTAPAGGAIQNYLVALRSDQVAPNAGQLMLNGTDVNARTSFSPYEFSQLSFVAGPAGSKQDLLVVAQTGTLANNDTLTNPVDSPPVQITATVTGTRSLNAVVALQTTPTGTDAGFVTLAREASAAVPTTTIRPSLGAVGNFTAVAGDKLAVSGLYTATAPSNGAIQNFKVALRSDQVPPNAGQLLLYGVDVGSRQNFSPCEFGQLSFVAGPAGTNQDLLVVAQTGLLNNDDTLKNPVDSAAVQITASVTGTRSINAAAALQTAPVGADAGFVALAKEASTATKASRPNVTTAGNFTAAAGDKFALAGLFAGPATAQNYKVALRGDQAAPNGGQLVLNGVDVSNRSSFSPYEFGQLAFVAGPSGSKQDLMVVAQTGTLANNDTLTNPVDSPAIQITASVTGTGTRSINAAVAWQATTGGDAVFMALATAAAAVTTATRPSLTTVGNFTAAVGDTLALSSLYAVPATAGVQNYKVALRGDQASPNGGQLVLNGVDVSARQNFSPYEFGQLAFVAGPSGSKQDLLVVAQTGTLNNDDTLKNPVDSAAIQITAGITGSRSINAAAALRTPTGTDAGFVALAAEATTLTGTKHANLTTVGNLTAAAGDRFALSGLYAGTAPAGGAIQNYKIALRSDQAAPNAGTLLLYGADVSSRQNFSPYEFSQLAFVAGPAGSTQDLLVVAQTGTLNIDDTLKNPVDSPAVQITASVTGTRSLNAARALQTTPTGGDAAFVALARQVNATAAVRPGLATVGRLGDPETATSLLATLLGAFQSTAAPATAVDVSSLYSSAVGRTDSTGSPTTNPALAAWTAENTSIGGYQVAGDGAALQRLAIAAYRAGKTGT